MGKNQSSRIQVFSGTGSHNPIIVNTYVDAVCSYLSAFSLKPSAIDIGCGDFNVGSKIRPYCSSYLALDIVQQVIDDNRINHHDADVEFRVLNIIEEQPPFAEVVLFVRFYNIYQTLK